MALPIYKEGQATEYALGKGWAHRRTGNHIVLEACPFCGKSYKFYWNDETGAWDCKSGACARKGNYFSLLREMGDAPASTRALPTVEKPSVAKKYHDVSALIPYEVELSSSYEALAYLSSRGITLETAQAWHLGVKDEGDKKWLMIPYIVDNQWVVDVKYRTLPPHKKSFKRMGGGDSVLFGEHLLSQDHGGEQKILYLCEGEIDAMTLWQQGYRPALSTTTGAGSFKPRWHDLIIAYNPDIIYVIYDSDVAGQEGARARLKQFDERQVRNVVLPTKDINEFFFPQDGTPTRTNEDFDALLRDVQPDEPDNILSIGTVLNRLEMDLFMTDGGFSGVPSQFNEINQLIGGGYWNGFLVTLSGIAGIGKTSFALQELMFSAANDIPSYLLCLEMPVEMMMRKILEHRFHINKNKLSVADIQSYRPMLDRFPMFLGDKVKDVKDLESTLVAAKKRFDMKIVAFDNINYFVRSPDRQAQEIGVVSKLLKDMAVALDITVVCVAQPTKFDNSERVMTQNDIKDSSAIVQDSDVVMLLSRQRNASTAKTFGKSAGHLGNYHPHTLVRVDKARYAPGGETILYFHGDVSTYRSLSDDEKTAMSAAA